MNSLQQLFQEPNKNLISIPIHCGMGTTEDHTTFLHTAPDSASAWHPVGSADEMRRHLYHDGIDLYGYLFQNINPSAHFSHEQAVFSLPDDSAKSISGEIFTEFFHVGDIFFERKYFCSLDVSSDYRTSLRPVFSQVFLQRESGQGATIWQKSGESHFHSEHLEYFSALFSELENRGFFETFGIFREKITKVLDSGDSRETLDIKPRQRWN